LTESDLWAPLDESYATTREHLHQIAFFAVSPARYKEAGRMGLQPTPRGFGTPQFGTKVARVSESLLVLEHEGNIATQEITNIRSAAEFLAGDYHETWFDDFHDPLAPMDPDSPLMVSAEHSRRIGDWFSFGFEALNALRATATVDDEVSEAQIWPEHFDAAAELGNAASGRRASFGASPGDGGHAEPYLYVAPWSDFDKSDSYWSATHFGGSLLGFRDLRESSDPAGSALDFYRDGYDRLHH
jgi:hypothetical protein